MSEGQRYNSEERLVVREGKSKVEAAALRERFGRLNGFMEEHILHLNREDGRTLRTLLYPEDVCGVAGVPSVWKSNGKLLRKFLMFCETIYFSKLYIIIIIIIFIVVIPLIISTRSAPSRLSRA